MILGVEVLPVLVGLPNPWTSEVALIDEHFRASGIEHRGARQRSIPRHALLDVLHSPEPLEPAQAREGHPVGEAYRFLEQVIGARPVALNGHILDFRMLAATEGSPHPSTLETVRPPRLHEVFAQVSSANRRNWLHVDPAAAEQHPQFPHLIDLEEAACDDVDMQPVPTGIKLPTRMQLKDAEAIELYITLHPAQLFQECGPRLAAHGYVNRIFERESPQEHVAVLVWLNAIR